MKKLSKDTWHYKNFSAWQDRTHSKRHKDLREQYSRTEQKIMPPKRQPDLCTYTRIVLLYGPFHRMCRFFINHPRLNFALWALIYYTAVASVSAFVVSQQTEETSYLWALAMPFILALGAVVVLAVVGTVCYIEDKVRELFRRRKYGARQGEKQPNIVLEYAKARKRKICPLLEFED